jgi:SulP family sulfate permease
MVNFVFDTILQAMEFGLVFADVDLLAWVPLFFFAATLIFIGFDLLAEWLVSYKVVGMAP